MTVTGKIKLIEDTRQVSDSFKVRDLILTTKDEYPQVLSIQFTQDKCDVLNAYKAGDDVEIAVNLRGREWVNREGVTKYFNTIQGWQIKKVGAEATEPQAETFVDEEDDGLAF